MRTLILMSMNLVLYSTQSAQGSFSIFHPRGNEGDFPFFIPPTAPVFKGNCLLVSRDMSTISDEIGPDPTGRTSSNCVLLPYDGTVSVSAMMKKVNWTQVETLVVYNPVNNTLIRFPKQTFSEHIVVVGKIVRDIVDTWGEPNYLTMGTNQQALSYRVQSLSIYIILAFVFVMCFIIRYSIHRFEQIEDVPPVLVG